MVKRVPFKASHLMRMVLQPSQEWLYPLLGPDEARELENPWAFSGIRDDGEVLICGGVLEYWKNRAYLWSCISVDAGPYMTTITRGARKLLRELPHARIEAAVPLDFPAGHRWARLLGMDLEVERARAYREDGSDCSIYVRIR